jgi:hypothetical protein
MSNSLLLPGQIIEVIPVMILPTKIPKENFGRQERLRKGSLGTCLLTLSCYQTSKTKDLTGIVTTMPTAYLRPTVRMLRKRATRKRARSITGTSTPTRSTRRANKRNHQSNKSSMFVAEQTCFSTILYRAADQWHCSSIHWHRICDGFLCSK